MINIRTDPELVDVNVTPDKRSVMIQQEADLLELLRSGLEDVWDPAKWQAAHSISQRTCGPMISTSFHANTYERATLAPVTSHKQAAEHCRSNKSEKTGPCKSTKKQDICVHFEKPDRNDHCHTAVDPESEIVCDHPDVRKPHSVAVKSEKPSTSSPLTHLSNRASASGMTVTGTQSTGMQDSHLLKSQSTFTDHFQQSDQPSKPNTAGNQPDTAGGITGLHAGKRKRGALAAALARSQNGGEEDRRRAGFPPLGSAGGGLLLRSPGKPPKRLGPYIHVAKQDLDERHAEKKLFGDDNVGKQDVKTSDPMPGSASMREASATTADADGIAIASSVQPDQTAAVDEKAGAGDSNLYRVGDTVLGSSVQRQGALSQGAHDSARKGSARHVDLKFHNATTMPSEPGNNEIQSQIATVADCGVNIHGSALATAFDGGQPSPRCTLRASPTTIASPNGTQTNKFDVDGIGCEHPDGAILLFDSSVLFLLHPISRAQYMIYARVLMLQVYQLGQMSVI